MARELRNAIYQELVRKKPAICVPYNRYKGWKASVDCCFIPALLLISKQFKEEYEEEIYRHATLNLSLQVFMATQDKGPEIPSISLPRSISANIRDVCLDIYKGHSGQIEELLKNRRASISRALDLPNIQTLQVDFISHAYVNRWFWGEETVNVEEFFANVDAFRNKCAELFDVEAYGGVYVEDRLYTPLMEALPDNFDVEEEMWFPSFVNDLPGNYVLQHVSQSKPNDPCSINGVRIEFLECGYFDVESYDALVRECCVPPEADIDQQ